MKTPDLEWKYIEYATTLRMTKNDKVGFIGFLIKTYLRMKLKNRLVRVINDFEENNITRKQYEHYSKVIKSAL